MTDRGSVSSAKQAGKYIITSNDVNNSIYNNRYNVRKSRTKAVVQPCNVVCCFSFNVTWCPQGPPGSSNSVECKSLRPVARQYRVSKISLKGSYKGWGKPKGHTPSKSQGWTWALALGTSWGKVDITNWMPFLTLNHMGINSKRPRSPHRKHLASFTAIKSRKGIWR